MCWDEFKEKDQIVTLACKHIWHPDCLRNIVRCPSCSQAIEGKTHTPEQIDIVVNKVFNAVKPFSPVIQRLDEEGLNDYKNKLKVEIIPAEEEIISSYDLFALADQMAELFDGITENNRQKIENSVNQCTSIVAEKLLYDFGRIPVDLYRKEFSIEEMVSRPRSYIMELAGSIDLDGATLLRVACYV